MPIKKRTLGQPTELQVPATESPSLTYTPDPSAVLHAFPHPKRAAFVLYADENPKAVPTDDLIALLRTPDNASSVDTTYRNRICGKATAVRAFCVFCVGGQPKKVRTCANIDCALWAFRMGNNPFRRKK